MVTLCDAPQVKKYVVLASQDIRFDVPLAEACYEDRQKFCANVPPVSLLGGWAYSCGVHMCLGVCVCVCMCVPLGGGVLQGHASALR